MEGLSRQPILRRFEARTADAAANYVEELFRSETKWEASSRSEQFLARFEVAVLGRIKLGALNLANYSVSRTPSTSIQIILPLAGDLRKREGGASQILRPACALSVSRPHVGSIGYSIEKGRGLILFVDARDIVERAGLLAGGAQKDFSIDQLPGTIDLRSQAGAALARNMKATMTEVTRLDSIGLTHLAQKSFEELLLNLTATALFPCLDPEVAARQPDGGSALIQRACAYIEAHASGPIDISLLAAELGVALRTLQENFRRYAACSPREFLLSRRLDLARSQLAKSGGGRTVTEIAFASGFSDLSHFAASYRTRFGELPSDTLRRSRC